MLQALTFLTVLANQDNIYKTSVAPLHESVRSDRNERSLFSEISVRLAPKRLFDSAQTGI